MKQLIDLNSEEAKQHFLKGSSYFNSDFPKYLDFTPILDAVNEVLAGKRYNGFQADPPEDFQDVNYSFIANKDGRLAWRPLEIIHPAIYVSLVNVICDPDNWAHIKKRFEEYDDGVVDCCSAPVMSLDDQTDTAKQVQSWWHKLEQRSLKCSLEFSHILHTDVTDCYGSIYTHSIPWALHGIEESKRRKQDKSLLGNKIDSHIRAGRYGQTNGIAQGSVLMDFIAEIVLGSVDESINNVLQHEEDFRILRYRDDYRIFANSDDRIEHVLKVVSDHLRAVGMKLGVSKTYLSRNVVEGSIKPDKLAGIDLSDLGDTNAKTIQKQLLRLHSFGQRYPNSGALRRLVTDFHDKIIKVNEKPDDLEVLIGISTDIGYVSPTTFPVIAGILSHLISLANQDVKVGLWEKVKRKMDRVPYNGYQEIWLQRVTRPKAIGIRFESKERICQIVNGEDTVLWENGWIASKDLIKALDVTAILTDTPEEMNEVVQPDEVALFKQKAWSY
ncbi:MAG: RNA-directed DNA polymerase [Calditrichaeota bacterium]|nr:RNA-directed DNA polymerase [Calditrichota bacterium]